MTDKPKNKGGRPRKDTYVVGEAELRKIIRDMKSLYPDALTAIKESLKGTSQNNQQVQTAKWVVQMWKDSQKELEHKLSNEKAPEADPDIDDIPDDDDTQPTAVFSMTMN